MTSSVDAGARMIDGGEPRLGPVIRAASRLIGAKMPADVIVQGASLYAIAGLVTGQHHADRARKRYLPITWNADSVRVGPLASPSRPVCIGCVERWTRDQWSRAIAQASGPTGWPDDWSPAFHAAVGAAIVGQATSPRETSSRVLVMASDLRTSSRHRVLAHPDCIRCSTKQADLAETIEAKFARLTSSSSSSYRAVDIAAAWPGLEQDFVDPRYGLVREVIDATPSVTLPTTFATISSDRKPTDVQVGVGRTGFRSADRAVAVAEAIERFAGFRPRALKTIVHARRRDLGDAAVDPRRFILHDPSQRGEPGYTFDPYDEDAVYAWVHAYSFREGRAVLVPEQLAYYALPPAPAEQGKRFVYETSNGCATGGSLAEATLHGLMELVERDGFLVNWYARLAKPRVEIRSVSDPLSVSLLARLRAEGFTVDLIDITSDIGLPTFAAVATQGSAGRPALSMAAGAHRDPVKAAQGALVELATGIRPPANDADARVARGRTLLAHPELVRTMSDHQAQCWPPEALIERGLPTTSEIVTWSDVEGRAQAPRGLIDVSGILHALVEKAFAACDDVLVVDQSFAAATTHGLHVVKVMAPGLLPMTFGNQYRRLSVERFTRAGVDLTDDILAGFSARPHAFP